MYDLASVIHVHSTFSDGTATVPEIAEAARRAGAEAVLLTDHDTREAARQGWEGWQRGVLVLVGHEITTRHGHFLAFGLEHEIDHRGLTETEICDRVRAAGGFGFAAHPFSQGGVLPSIIRPHPWRSLLECGPFGIELWSLITDAAERWRTPGAALRFLRRPESCLAGPPPPSLEAWDWLCQQRRVPAIGGLDAHQTGVRVRGRVLSPMPHDRYFKLLQTHVLLDSAPRGELMADRAAAYAALASGRCYLAVDAYAPASGFTYQAVVPDGSAVAMGEEVKVAGPALQVRVPRDGMICLLRNGEPVQEVSGAELEHPLAQPGVYRVEVRLDVEGAARPWIFSNPIYVR